LKHSIQSTNINEYKYTNRLNISNDNEAIEMINQKEKSDSEKLQFYTECYYIIRKDNELHKKLDDIKYHPLNLIYLF